MKELLVLPRFAVCLAADDGGAVAAGVVFGILLPTALLALAFYLVIKHLTLVVSWGGLAPSVVLAARTRSDAAEPPSRLL
jgi:hypothetical protein